MLRMGLSGIQVPQTKLQLYPFCFIYFYLLLIFSFFPQQSPKESYCILHLILTCMYTHEYKCM